MNARFQPALGTALRRWRLRQKTDGRLLRVMVLGSLFPVAGFFSFPSAGSAFFLGFYLAAMGVACVRLLIAAAKVAEIDHLIHPVPEIIDAEVLDYSDLQLIGPGSGLDQETSLTPSTRLIADDSGLN